MTQRQGPGVPISGDEVFLTPRIIDRLAFEEYANFLRGLIHQASGEGNALRQALVEVKQFDQAAKTVTGELQRRLEAVSRLIPAIDERLARLESLASTAMDHAALARRVEQQIDEAVNRRLEAAMQRASALAAGLETKASQAEERLQAAWQRATSEAERASGELAGRIAEVTGELDARLRNEAGPTESRLTEATEQANAALQRIERELPGLQQRIEQAGEQVDDRLQRVTSGLDQRVEQIKNELASATGPAITNLSLLCHRAVDIIGRDPRLSPEAPGVPPPRPGSLGELVQRAERAQEDARTITQRFESIRTQAEELASRQERSRQMLHEIERTCERVDAVLSRRRSEVAMLGSLPGEESLQRLAERAAELRASMADAAQHHQRAEQAASRTAEALARSSAITARVQELQSLVDLAEARSAEALAATQQHVARLEALLSESEGGVDERTRAMEARVQAASAEASAIQRELEAALRAATPAAKPAQKSAGSQNKRPAKKASARSASATAAGDTAKSARARTAKRKPTA